MTVQKHDGSVFPALTNKNEVIAAKKIYKWEILGHYAGKRFFEKIYDKGAHALGGLLINIDSYSYGCEKMFISGFREGNITIYINACTTYASGDESVSLPKRNVSFINHKENGVTIPFVIAMDDIEPGESLWLDYGKQYWQVMNTPINVDEEDN